MKNKLLILLVIFMFIFGNNCAVLGEGRFTNFDEFGIEEPNLFENLDVTWDSVRIPNKIVGVDSQILNLYNKNNIVKDKFSFAHKNIRNDYEENLINLENNNLAYEFLKKHSNSEIISLQSIYAKNEVVQINILFNYNNCKNALLPIMDSNVLVKNNSNMVESTIRYIYENNTMLEEYMNIYSISEDEFESLIVKLVEREKQQSSLAILYLGDAYNFTNQDISIDKFDSFLSRRFNDEMFELELLFSYETAELL